MEESVGMGEDEASRLLQTGTSYLCVDWRENAYLRLVWISDEDLNMKPLLPIEVMATAVYP